MSTQKVAQVTSGAEPQTGQKNRSSNNFAIPFIPEGTKSFTFKVIPPANNNADSIRFNVYSDNPLGPDGILWGGENIESEVHNGYQSSQHIKTYEEVLYIGNPSGATGSFGVEIWANY
jgi:hypothetical protein